MPGRMGLVITLCLISFNVYNVVEAPPTRGFSNAETWMIGMELPIVLAALEYSIILGLKRCIPNTIERHAGKVDAITCFLSVSYILLFSICYWFFMIPASWFHNLQEFIQDSVHFAMNIFINRNEGDEFHEKFCVWLLYISWNYFV